MENPRTPQEALPVENANKWFNAIKEEMINMKKKQAWDIIKRPRKENIIGGRWVYKVKRKIRMDDFVHSKIFVLYFKKSTTLSFLPVMQIQFLVTSDKLRIN